MIKKISTLLALALLASCATKKGDDSCPTCPITGKPLGKPAQPEQKA